MWFWQGRKKKRDGLMNFQRIRDYVHWYGMLDPYLDEQVKGPDIISYGPSGAGYDIRIANEFRVCTPMPDKRHGYTLDPKNFQEFLFDEYTSMGCCRIPANSFLLGRTVERFRVPENVLCVCVGKSTYARCGQIVNVTPFEPGWEGYVTLEVSNTTPLPAKIYANEGIAQVLFFEMSEKTLRAYGKGKYQNQGAEIVMPRMFGRT